MEHTRVHLRHGIQKYFWQIQLVDQADQLKVINIQYNGTLYVAAAQYGRHYKTIRIGGWHIRIHHIYIMVGKLLCHPVYNICPEGGGIRP